MLGWGKEASEVLGPLSSRSSQLGMSSPLLLRVPDSPALTNHKQYLLCVPRILTRIDSTGLCSPLPCPVHCSALQQWVPFVCASLRSALYPHAYHGSLVLCCLHCHPTDDFSHLFWSQYPAQHKQASHRMTSWFRLNTIYSSYTNQLPSSLHEMSTFVNWAPILS